MAVDWIGATSLVASQSALNVQAHTGTLTGDTGLLMVVTANETVATPTGDSGTWVPLGDQQGTGTAGQAGAVRLALFTMTFTQGYSSSRVPCTIADTGDVQIARMVVMRGFMGIEAVAGGVVTPASTTMTWPGVTVTMPDSVIVNLAGMDRDYAGDVSGTLSGYTNADTTNNALWLSMSSSTGTGGGILWWDASATKTGAIAGTTITCSTSQTYACITIAINEHTQTAKALTQITDTASTPRRAINKALSQMVDGITSFVAELQSTVQEYFKTLSNIVSTVTARQRIITITRASVADIASTPRKQGEKVVKPFITATETVRKSGGKVITHIMSGVSTVRKSGGKIVAQVTDTAGTVRKQGIKVLLSISDGATTVVKQGGKVVNQITTGASTSRQAIAKGLQTITDAGASVRKAMTRTVTNIISGLTSRNNTPTKFISQMSKASTSPLRGIGKAISQIITGASDVKKSAGKIAISLVTGATSFVGEWITGITEYLKTITVSITSRPTVQRGMDKIITNLVNASQVVRKSGGKVLASIASASGTIRKQGNKIVTQVVNSASTVKKSISKTATAVVISAGTIIKRSYKTFNVKINGLTGILKAVFVEISQKTGLNTQNIKVIEKRLLSQVSGISSFIAQKIAGLIEYTKTITTGIVASPIINKGITQIVTAGIVASTLKTVIVGKVMNQMATITDALSKANAKRISAGVTVGNMTAKIIAVTRTVGVILTTSGTWLYNVMYATFKKIDGVWVLMVKTYTKISGAWREMIVKKKNGGNW